MGYTFSAFLLHFFRCAYCQLYLSPNKFIFHFHRVPGSRYHHPDAANFNSWRRHLTLDYRDPPEQLVHAWEDVKAMFNGGSRKRLVSPPPPPTAKRTDATAPAPADRRQLDECAAAAAAAAAAGRAKRPRATAVVHDEGQAVASTAAVQRPRAGFYVQPAAVAAAAYPGHGAGTCTPARPYAVPAAGPAAPPPPTPTSSLHSSPVPYYDVIMMQVPLVDNS